MRTRIGTRLILGVGLVTSVTIGLMTVLVIRTHRQELIDELTRSADQLSETIKSSTHHDMLENRRDAVHRQIETIGRQQGIDRVRVFNKDGRIMYSSEASEIGLVLDKRAESCYVCHAEGAPLERLPTPARARIFRDAAGERSLGIINPIHNEPSCSTAACHAHDAETPLLGVLDVTMPLAAVDGQIAASQRRMAAFAALAVLASSLLLWWLNRLLVIRPTRALLDGTRRVAEGDLAVAVPAAQGHELGELARAFNTMTEKLADARRQLTQADRLAAVGSLAAGVAHEINNPLTGVLTGASLLLQHSGDDPRLRGELEVIVRETVRCREIVKGLLDFARPKTPHRQPTDANEVVRRSVGIVMNRLALSRIGLRLDLAPDLPRIAADPHQLEQVLVNLLLNAADAIGKNGSVRIASRRAPGPAALRTVDAGSAAGSGDMLEIEVQDDGPGIPPEHLPRLFDPFFTTKGTRGTGLGLAVSWSIVEAHGGAIDVKSEPGQGSTFVVRIPVDPARARPAARPEPSRRDAAVPDVAPPVAAGTTAAPSGERKEAVP